MFKLLVLAVVVAAANAGLIGAGLGHGALVAAPVAVAHAPLASSYQNSNSISLHPTAVVATHAVAAPVAVAHAPVAVAAAPLAVGYGHGIGIGHGIGLGHGLLH